MQSQQPRDFCAEASFEAGLLSSESTASTKEGMNQAQAPPCGFGTSRRIPSLGGRRYGCLLHARTKKDRDACLSAQLPPSCFYLPLDWQRLKLFAIGPRHSTVVDDRAKALRQVRARHRPALRIAVHTRKTELSPEQGFFFPPALPSVRRILHNRSRIKNDNKRASACPFSGPWDSRENVWWIPKMNSNKETRSPGLSIFASESLNKVKLVNNFDPSAMRDPTGTVRLGAPGVHVGEMLLLSLGASQRKQ